MFITLCVLCILCIIIIIYTEYQFFKYKKETVSTNRSKIYFGNGDIILTRCMLHPSKWFFWPSACYLNGHYETHSAVVVKLDGELFVADLGCEDVCDYFTKKITSNTPVFIRLNDYIDKKIKLGYTLFHHKCKLMLPNDLDFNKCKDNIHFTNRYLYDLIVCNILKLQKKDTYFCTDYVEKILYDNKIIDSITQQYNFKDIFNIISKYYEPVVMVL